MGAHQKDFQPIDPWCSPDLKRTRRDLPHLEVQGATYFVTYRCRPHLVLPPQARSVALAAIRYWDGTRIDLDAAVIMPDHAHALFRIVDGSLLENIQRSVKGYSGRAINKLIGRQGPFWQDESFDHIVRDQASWESKMEYIQQNPVHKGLVGSFDQYPWLYVRGKP